MEFVVPGNDVIVMYVNVIEDFSHEGNRLLKSIKTMGKSLVLFKEYC